MSFFDKLFWSKAKNTPPSAAKETLSLTATLTPYTPSLGGTIKMSIFSGIVNAEHTFAAWAEKELENVFAQAPKVEQIIDVVLKYAGPALQLVVTASLGTGAGSIVAKVIADAQASLTAASGLIYDFGATPSVASIVSSVQQNLADLLAAGHVTDVKSVSAVTKVINELALLASVIPQIASALPAAAPTTAPAAKID